MTQGNGSDVFGSDICTCKPYLIYAIEECVRCAQRGGVGLVVYFRKEGRALGEVTKSVFSLQFSTIDMVLTVHDLLGTLSITFESVVATPLTDTSSPQNLLPVARICDSKR